MSRWQIGNAADSKSVAGGKGGSIPPRLTKKETEMQIYIILSSIAICALGALLALQKRRFSSGMEDYLALIAKLTGRMAEFNTRLKETNERLSAAENIAAENVEAISQLLDQFDDMKTEIAEMKEHNSAAEEIVSIKERLSELEGDTAGGNAALDQMFLAGLNGIMNYGLREAEKK